MSGPGERPPRLVPDPVGPNAEFFAYLARGELRLQRCARCRRWRHPPRHRCASCGSTEATWERASGRGRVFSWTVTHRAVDPAFEPPYAIVVVETDEGPRLVGNLAGDDPADLARLALDVPVVIEVEPVSEAFGLVQFRLAPPM
ncbi:MAG: hypothetical protein KatS3mg009_1205 [Acidimicrobiia bacterium]|nr:MAG: hypothetical protein KatS3mg009_1205 [Acidimicrobiia bacterium]